jgi:hypothetical protein
MTSPADLRIWTNLHSLLSMFQLFSMEVYISQMKHWKINEELEDTVKNNADYS